MSSVPDKAKKPQDHRTAKSEAKGEDTTIEFHDETYTISSDALDNIEVLEWIEEETYIKAIKAIIGDSQWKGFKDSIREEDGRVPSEPFQEFIEKVFSNLGG